MGSPPKGRFFAIEVAAEGGNFAPEEVELGDVESATPGVGVLPDEEDLVDRAQGVNFELVVAVAAVDEQFDVVLGEDEGVALGQLAGGVGFLNPEGDVEVLVVVEERRTGVEESRLAGRHVSKALGSDGASPRLLVEIAVDDDGNRRATANGGFGHQTLRCFSHQATISPRRWRRRSAGPFRLIPWKVSTG